MKPRLMLIHGDLRRRASRRRARRRPVLRIIEADGSSRRVHLQRDRRPQPPSRGDAA